MNTCVQERREEYLGLMRRGFTKATIERGFNRITILKNAERKGGKKQRGMNIIKQATQKRSIYSYILRDALESMLKNWNAKELGRLAEHNLETYKKVCNEYLISIIKLLEDDK
jgi:hypothetical protein